MSNDARYTFREIVHGSQEYIESVQLRDAVLRKPLGLEFDPSELGAESSDIHLACFDMSSVLIGCLVLTPETEVSVRMRQVAILPRLQRTGVGTELVAYSESVARTRGFSEMTMHAREQAVPFYERLGYQRVGDAFEEVTIPHWILRKQLR